jgi:hypothetical protein
MTDRVLPNLFIIGAMKAGTTSLHACLGDHPEIFMTPFKEPQYFAPHKKAHAGVWGQGGELPEPGIDWYLRLFAEAGAARYAGESSTSYTKAPWVTGCAERIHAFNPDARLIYLLRDPADRTLSHYWYEVRGRWETRPPLEAVQRVERYTAFSDYARQLRPYLDAFGREAVHVLTLEELLARPAEALNRLFEWLGVEPLGSAVTFESHNVGPPEIHQLRPAFLRLRRLQRHWRWRQIANRHPRIARLTEHAMFRPVRRRAEDEAATRAYLRPIQQQHVRVLSALLGREFPEWPSVSPDAPT